MDKTSDTIIGKIFFLQKLKVKRTFCYSSTAKPWNVVAEQTLVRVLFSCWRYVGSFDLCLLRCFSSSAVLLFIPPNVFCSSVKTDPVSMALQDLLLLHYKLYDFYSSLRLF